jgi:pimeloyl-ACP methyl ester carboxylesterase
VLGRVRAPTLLIVGGADLPVISLNRTAQRLMTMTACELAIVPGATHLFEEHGALEAVARLARDWFTRYVPQPSNGGNHAPAVVRRRDV